MENSNSHFSNQIRWLLTKFMKNKLDEQTYDRVQKLLDTTQIKNT